MQKIIIIGGGAAGFFTAINIAEKHPDYQVTILEKTDKLLSKVKVSGGGRCNVTNARSTPSELVRFYPRGQKKLHPVFNRFSTSDMVQWLEQRGVKTHAEADQRMFPVSNSSQTVIDCFLNEAFRLRVKILRNCAMTSLEQTEGDRWLVRTNQEDLPADKVIVCTGSSPALWKQLESFGLEVTPPVPSLFTFNIRDERIAGLPGVSFPEVRIRITGTKLEASGPLLITHWGLSGPAVLKLSAWGARELAEVRYRFSLLINFLGGQPPEHIRQLLLNEKVENPKRKVVNYPPGGLPKRSWEQLTGYCGIGTETLFGALSKSQLNKLTEELTQGLYPVTGKSTFKEEFVTSGGVKLSEIDLDTFECRKFKNLYLAGEVLDIDALTGGFNFQACWSAGWVISEGVRWHDYS